MFSINDCGNSTGNFHLRSKRSNQHPMQLSSRAWYRARRKEKKKYFADAAAVIFLNVHIIFPKYNCHFHLTISSCVSVRMSKYWAFGKFGEHERGVRVARGVAESNSSLMSAQECSPNFSSAQYLDIRTDEAWTNCFITLSKRSMQQLT